jgi:hypothetical protein
MPRNLLDVIPSQDRSLLQRSWPACLATKDRPPPRGTARQHAVLLVLYTVMTLTGCNDFPSEHPGQTATMLQENILLGIATTEPTQDSGDADQVIATSATLNQAGTVESMSIYITTSGAVGHGMLAIYNATGSGGAPGALVAQTPSFTLTSGWNTQSVTTPVALQAGSYYVAFTVDNNGAGPVYGAGTARSNYYKSLGSYGTFPTAFGSGTSQPGIAYSEYATLTTACTPTTCAAQKENCGSISDGCGGELNCGTCTAPATCGGGGTPNVCGGGSTTLLLGTSSTEPTQDGGDADQVIATSAALNQTGTVESMSIYIATSGAVGHGMLAIYNATGSGGGPGALVAQTPSFTLTSGWNTHAVATSVTLQAGSYYLAFSVDNDGAGPVYGTGTASANYYESLGSYGTFPTAFGSGISQPGIMYSEYATLTASTTCTPTTCVAEGKNCGSISDGCGGELNCGSCTAPATCGGGGMPNVCGGGGGHSYMTTFPLTENPISEGGKWVSGGIDGENGDVYTTGGSPGLAQGTPGHIGYADAVAALTGTWAPNQSAQATVGGIGTLQDYPEVELHLHQTITSSGTTGYEITHSVGGSYVLIATWNGTPGTYTVLKELYGSQYSVKDGDIVEATVINNVISVYKNGALEVQVTDGTYPTGSPGFGFNAGSNGTYGITSFTGSD